MPNLAFEYHPDAIREAWEALHWYAARSETAAENFWNDLIDARRAVSLHPDTWAPYLHGTKCFRLARYPYGLVYIKRGDLVIGIAVAHFKRRPGYWKDRVRS
jgi:toxin ParE1/3/4